MRSLGAGSASIDIKLSQNGIYRGRDRNTSEGRAFIGGAWLLSVAAEYGHIQIYNPAGSGVVVLLDWLRVLIPASSEFSVCSNANPLAFLQAQWQPKKIGGTVGKAQVRYASLSSQTGVQIYPSWLGPDDTLVETYGDPFMLEEGQGIMVRNDVTTSDIGAVFQGREL